MLYFLFYKYYGMRDLMRVKDNKEVRAKFYPFTRDDLDKLHVFWCFPFYSTYLIRVALLIVICGFTGFIAELFMAKDQKEQRNFTDKK